MLISHFDFLAPEQRAELFECAPLPLCGDEHPHVIGGALGATLYMPADRPTLVSDIIRRRAQGVQSVVIDLEDSIAARDRPGALTAAAEAVRLLASEEAALPLIFVRAPDPTALLDFAHRVGERSQALAGFALPKFDAPDSGPAYFAALQAAETVIGHRLWAMPILEGATIAHRETRMDALLLARKLIDGFQDRVVCVRIGATDLSSAFGLRRNGESTIYDVRVVADAIADIVNVFARDSPWSYPISGAVWEHFSTSSRLYKPRLREAPFLDQGATDYRRTLLSSGLDGLIAEVGLDQINGLTGKTIIHPSHVAVVHALSAVTHEEYSDATAIAATRADGGLVPSLYANKMNETTPHGAWAQRTLVRGQAFGVLRPDTTFVDLLLTADRMARC